ncbi:glycine cleavage system aminomethyltransferase GcvT [Nakamurella sp. YIM 132087]|uniref:aminomethyltransferase n=1 Tax=Nakamurella alba TaxID=2665158 RepID=A0A7K1FJ91_9ACTN|nr:glycine cleavage system aminomethyltransferase GcvT [Nakamurella alba]MTD13509.1 glycine cleavage system aminomethyltransferase GcvT [Nakamurella alba]
MHTPGSPDALLTSPLHEAHVALGATMAPFGGWEMPISYAGGGVVAEHTAVREAVGVFDVSHLGKATVTGPGAAGFVNRCLTADLRKIGPGKAQYTLCCDESGGVIDDLIAYVVSDDEVFLVPNAANTAAVVAVLQAAAPDGIEVVGRHREFGVIAVQGPRSAELVAAVGLPTDLDYMGWADGTYDGLPVRVCRTGYTGEHGYELLPAWDVSLPLWNALLEKAADLGGRAAGLGARDTLRTEMGYPLHGQDLGPDISPVQARASWAVGWKKDEFFGRTALLAERENGPVRTLWGLLALGRGVIRPHMSVVDAAGTAIGETTSGTFSPTLQQGIGLALLDTVAGLTEGDEIAVDVRGRSLPVRVVKPPFVPSHVR